MLGIKIALITIPIILKIVKAIRKKINEKKELLKEVILEKKLENSDQVLFCAQRELTNHLMNKDLS